MIIAVGGTKGGTGKSTVSTNLAVILAASGRDVLLVDADDQGTAGDFTTMRNQSREDGAGYTCIALKGRAVVTEIMRLRPKYDDIVIDVGAGETASQKGALAVADLYLVPMAPRSFDVWTLEKVAALVEDARVTNPKLDAAVFLNRADASGSENEAAAEIITAQPALRLLKATLGNRKSYARASTAGLAVTELRPADAKASAEVRGLVAEIGAGATRKTKAPAKPKAKAGTATTSSKSRTRR
ncbi:AAA family ATPase [uncultured Alsobacter sp.]|uniref:AAA family ATPase n=1 Tax=uncultured Alsobacter sp. TaxID=1748258 RepID=UPI0025CDC709|nr:AAA family ATPase [uncultured Alsobacter sp.]